MALEFIPTWANAIAQFEGFNSPGSRPARNNNPGDLKFAGQSGAIGKDTGNFAVFPDPGTGFQALYNQLARYVSQFPSDSILDIMAHYLGQASPGADTQGNAYTYAAFVASQLGVDISTTLSQLVAGAGAPSGVPVPPGLANQTIDQPIDPALDATGQMPASTPGSLSTGEIVGIMAGLALIAMLVLRD
jgi:hypothetical protein